MAAEAGQPVLGWRDVPVAVDQIGVLARRAAPHVRQVFLARNGMDTDAFERKLYIIRRQQHRRIFEAHGDADACYVASLSGSTLVYKGLLKGPQVPQFSLDHAHDPRSLGERRLHGSGAQGLLPLPQRPVQDHGLERDLDVHLIDAARAALERRRPVRLEFDIGNTQRSIGARL